MVDFNGTAVEYVVNGDRAHRFTLPTDRNTIPAKVIAALKKVDVAREAEAAAVRKDGNDRLAHRAANEKLGAAVADLYDVASSSSRSRLEHHREEYAYAKAKFERALADAGAALQSLADHAQQADNPTGVGFPQDPRATSKQVMQLHLIADTLRNLPAVPELEGGA